MIRVIRAAPVQPVPFAQFESEVLAVYGSRREKATTAKVGQILGELGSSCASTSDITEKLISDWIAEHGERSVMTKRSLLSAFRAACTIGAERHYLDSPFWTWSLDHALPEPDPDELDRPWLYLNADQVSSVLRQSRSDIVAGVPRAWDTAAIAHLGAYTGARSNEILGAYKTDIDLATKTFAIRSNPRRRLKVKATKRTLPLVDPLVDFLRAYLPRVRSIWLVEQVCGAGPWFNGGSGYKPVDYIRRLGERAGVNDLSIETFRHTFSSAAEEWGWTERQLQRWLGHTRPQTQRWYRRKAPRSLVIASQSITYQTVPA